MSGHPVDLEWGLASALKGLVFLTVLLTVVLQGLTAPWLARRLGLVDAEPPVGSAAPEPLPGAVSGP
jgi:NhaP-type Na+/H+ or K+/H+ antiporter